MPSDEVLAFQRWYEKAGVRRTPRRLLRPGEDLDRYSFFPRHLIPHMEHPRVLKDPELARYLEAQYLFQWLNFTAHFEVGVVNRATHLISTGRAGIECPPDVQQGAFQIYVDEGYHSLYSLDMVRQLEARSGIDAVPYDFDEYLDGLDAVGHDYPGHGRLVQLLQVVTFETLVTGILLDVPKDPTLIPEVREIVQDHAVDEGTHHAYFSAFFKRLWGTLSVSERQMVARWLPDLILRSLKPATTPTANALRAVGTPEAEIREIIGDSFSPAAVVGGIRRSSVNTVRLFASMGILDDAQTHDAFARAGLAPEEQ
ncbi:diiron oxygenase [Kineosporia sp. J2-2]|uniref:Diiron oxygenase n=1 Tax=Kineosporia corallincola TaxID=2835133 RepID=A0ABS5TCY1_9ACTN|nr:diiron oxygenase [Kineosporia corallincola]MBT0768284.1 diiron oxygenase [Kineosporia corallincola]